MLTKIDSTQREVESLKATVEQLSGRLSEAERKSGKNFEEVDGKISLLSASREENATRSKSVPNTA